MNKIQEEFYKTFGVEPKYQDRCALEDRCKEQGLPWASVEAKCPYKMDCTDNCKDAYKFAVYPQITAEKILKLMVILLCIEAELTISLSKCEYGAATGNYGGYFQGTIGKSILSLSNEFYKDMSVSQRNQVKGIIENE